VCFGLPLTQASILNVWLPILFRRDFLKFWICWPRSKYLYLVVLPSIFFRETTPSTVHPFLFFVNVNFASKSPRRFTVSPAHGTKLLKVIGPDLFTLAASAADAKIASVAMRHIIKIVFFIRSNVLFL